MSGLLDTELIARICRDVAQAASHRGGPGSSTGHVTWDLWWTKQQWGRFSPSTSVSSVKHSTDCSTIIIIIIIIICGWYDRLVVASVIVNSVQLPSPLNNIQ
jgi:hypothetical protein